MSQTLVKTPSLNILEDYHLSFNFSFLIIPKKLDNIFHKKVFNKIFNYYSKMSIKDFKNHKGINKETRENDENMLIKHKNYVNYSKKKYNSSFKTIYDIYREDKGMRAYGVLNHDIFYLLEINPDHDERN